MRVCWLVRENLLEQPGGDTTQILQTAEALRRLGASGGSDATSGDVSSGDSNAGSDSSSSAREPITIDFVSNRRPDFSGYDLVHLFHLDRLWENEPHCRRLRAQRRPAVLSTIYWPADAFDRGGRAGLQGLLARAMGSENYRSLRLLQRWALDLRRAFRHGGIHRPTWNFHRSARYCLETMSVLLPNSRAEQEVIEAELGVPRPTVVVPNAVGQEFLQTPSASSDQQRGVRQGVLCVGRIEPRKNQLALIRAVQESDILLTLIGQAGRYSRSYEARCRAEAGPNVRFVGQSTSAELRGWYDRSLVHVCPSWYETPGLVNLEAAACGCAIVATPGGCTREYLGDMAHYCEPNDVDSIHRAIEEALREATLREGPRANLRDHIVCKYSWDAAARKTLEAYKLALSAS